MTVEAGLYAHLSTDAGVNALVGTRIYPLLVPLDATLPAIAYQRISGPRDHHHQGASGLAVARIQLTYVGGSYSEAKQVAAAVRATLDGRRGGLGSTTVGSIMLDNERDEWSTGFELPVVQQDYVIWYQEA